MLDDILKDRLSGSVREENKLIKKYLKSDMGLDVKNIKRVPGGYSSNVHSGLLDDQKVFIRMRKTPSGYPEEIFAYKKLREVGVPTPKVIAFKKSPRHIKMPTLIIEAHTGVSLNSWQPDSSSKRRHILQLAGKTLKKVHKVSVKGFGSLSIKNNGLCGRYKTWKQYMDNALNFDLIKHRNLLNTRSFNKIINIREELKTISPPLGLPTFTMIFTGLTYLPMAKK